jgi:hypothetical protein
MKYADLQERWLAAEQLWKLDNNRREEVTEGLLAVIGSAPEVRHFGQLSHGGRWGAAQALGRMGADAATALPVLSAVAKDDVDEWMRHYAKEACERIELAVSELRRGNEKAEN